MLGKVFLMPVDTGTLSSAVCIGSLLPFLGLSSMMMDVGVWPQILWFGLLEVGLSVGGPLSLLETTLCCLDHRGFGLEGGSSGLIFTSLGMMLDAGLSLLVLW